MIQRVLFCLRGVLLLMPSLAVIATGQDFQKSYSLGPEGSVSIHNISGEIQVNGYDGESIQVKGRDRDRVQVEDHSNGNRVELGVSYPRNGNCDASIRFQIDVPRGSEL